MITSIRRAPKEPEAEPTAIDLLIECHGRIRQFTDISIRLAEAEGAPLEEIREAAKRLVRYFTIALPLHSEDEDDSLHPRLSASKAPPEVKDAIDEMVKEHGPIHQTIDELVILWEKLVDNPERHDELRPRLGEHAERLSLLFEPHLAKEETIIFPAAKSHLGQEELDAILEELRARREAAMRP